jgi:hypothetical protein
MRGICDQAAFLLMLNARRSLQGNIRFESIGAVEQHSLGYALERRY